jgi:hypothetical protein
MPAEFDMEFETYIPPSRRRKRPGRKPNPDRAIAVATRVSLADRDRLDLYARRRGVTTSDLLRAALESVLQEAREETADVPGLAPDPFPIEERRAA